MNALLVNYEKILEVLRKITSDKQLYYQCRSLGMSSDSAIKACQLNIEDILKIAESIASLVRCILKIQILKYLNFTYQSWFKSCGINKVEFERNR